MIMRGSLGNAETNRHGLEKPFAGQTKVFADKKNNFVASDLKRSSGDQWFIGASVRVRDRAFDERPNITLEPIQFEPNIRGGPAVGGVQNVRGQSGIV